MENFYDLPIVYKGEEFDFQVRLATVGYQIKWFVMVDDHEITFERDDEMNYRAVAYDASQPLAIDAGLLEAIAATLQQLDQ